ncbi:hypothetical protein PIB30_095743 [Stylosanthes scabra]|uniref:Uncharacterized protein n=1 Tax=Stylosanthes scabra TaxID=79078 RepID=A0ABU6XVJ0_9FABA|nr:hypothetical protein [Stylosanthes scabra]
MADNPNKGLTLRELCSLDLAFQLQHARYPERNANFELKSGLINLLPRYHGLPGLSPNDKALIDASSGSCLLGKTPEEARELIENIADASQHFRTRASASSFSKGVFGVTPNESPDLAKAMGDIASVLKDIREGQQNLLNTQH